MQKAEDDLPLRDIGANNTKSLNYMKKRMKLRKRGNNQCCHSLHKSCIILGDEDKQKSLMKSTIFPVLSFCFFFNSINRMFLLQV